MNGADVVLMLHYQNANPAWHQHCKGHRRYNGLSMFCGICMRHPRKVLNWFSSMPSQGWPHPSGQLKLPEVTDGGHPSVPNGLCCSSVTFTACIGKGRGSREQKGKEKDLMSYIGEAEVITSLGKGAVFWMGNIMADGKPLVSLGRELDMAAWERSPEMWPGGHVLAKYLR